MLPRRLTKNSTIGFVAPSDPVEGDKRHQFDAAEKKLKEYGFNTVISPQVSAKDKHSISAGEPQTRADAINSMFSDKKIDAVWCVHGGHTANQVLDLLDYDKIRKNPKIFMGMSDIDVLHLAIHAKTGMMTFNTADPKLDCGYNLDFPYSWESLIKRMLEGSKTIIPSSERRCIREGKAEGRILGCNLNSILKLAGTDYLLDFSGCILFLEGYTFDVKEVTWKLEQLRQMGIFNKINGIVIGYIYGFQDKALREQNRINAEFEELVLDAVKDHDFPILKTNDFGHRTPHCFLPIGAKVRMDAEKLHFEIAEEFLK